MSDTRSNNTFEAVPERPSFPAEEEKVGAFWKEIDAFKTSYEESVKEGRPAYRFYDGPPFATGLPHYGHILAGTLKDVVTRYAHQTGHCVERRFGWDCHGLPVEHEVDKDLKITCREDVLNMGIDKYNEYCKSIVMRYASEWQVIVERLGRWVDFENDYRTMYKSYMESVWWVFKQLFNKGLVYRAFKVMPFSTACGTPLSNFEANLNYKDVHDPSIIISFPRVDVPTCDFLAWTTTPWTLPANMAVCLNPKSVYVCILNKKSGRDFIVMESRLSWVCKEIHIDETTDIEVKQKYVGKDLEGIKYKPLYECFNKPPYNDSAFRSILGDFVEETGGTGVVHTAPAFGEDDYNACCANKVIVKESGSLPCPVDMNGRFTSEVPSYEGMYVKDAEKVIRNDLKHSGRLLANATSVHSYPHCWRSDTPLIYKAVPCWFINIQKLKQRILDNTEITHWVPSVIKERRFRNWIQDSPDWCVSRNRFWGTPIPLWCSEDFKEIKCVGDVGELQHHNGCPIDDLHRQFIDDIEIPSDIPGNPPLRRVDEVFDCWFESGSMPYAQDHYPFERKTEFEKTFPADFVAEGLDQTRGWFYTLMVLSTALFDKPAFKNLICNGLILAEDGKKMSKRLKNYADPLDVVNRYGADAIRLYLVNSPAVRAETLKFSENGVRDVVKDVFLPWFNAYRFLCQEVTRFESSPGGQRFVPNASAAESSSNIMDKWIHASSHNLIQYVHNEMKAYRLYSVAPSLLHFLGQLTNWYVRLNRDRMRGQMGSEEAYVSLRSLYEVLLIVTKLMAPFTPFLSEYIYKNLSRALPLHPDKKESVHFVMLPKANKLLIDEVAERRVERMQRVIEIGRLLRDKRKCSLKTPVKTVTVIHPDKDFIEGMEILQQYIQEELNAINVKLSTDISGVRMSADPNNQVLGPRLGKSFSQFSRAVKILTHEQLELYARTGEITIDGVTVNKGDLVIRRTLREDVKMPGEESDGDNDVLVTIDFTEEEGLQRMALAREVVNRIQKIRKKLQLKQDDPVSMFAGCTALNSPQIYQVLTMEKESIERMLRRQIKSIDELPANDTVVVLHDEETAINAETVRLVVAREL